MKAMIFAAGLGTRLRPITHQIPKALVEVGGIPMIERVIINLKAAGVDGIIINLHHFPDKIKDFVASRDHFHIDIHYSDESSELLDTGGGLKKAAWFFEDDQPFFVHNADVLTSLDLNQMMNHHLKNRPLATLFVMQRKTSRYLMFDNRMRLCGWKNVKTGEEIISRKVPSVRDFAFNGIHIVEPEIFNMILREGKFSITPTYLDLASEHKINGFENHDAGFIDIGNPENLNEAEKFVKDIRSKKPHNR